MNNNITEKVERYNEIGQVVRVSLKWRGKTYMLQMFFPGSKFPSRQEVETQVKKIYPDSVVMVHYASETQPNQPLIRVSEGAMVAKKKPKMNPKNMTIPANQPYSGPDYRRLTASHEPQGDQINELLGGKPGDGYLGSPKIGIPNPIRLAKDAVDSYNRSQQKNVNTINKELPGSAKMGKFKQFNKDTSAAYKRYLGSSYEPDGEMVQEMPDELEAGMQKAKNIAKRNIIRKKGEELGKSERTSGDPDLKKGGPRSHFNSYQPEGEVVNEEESQNPTFTQFMKRIDQLPEVTREAIKNCGNDPMIAKAALEISGIDK